MKNSFLRLLPLMLIFSILMSSCAISQQPIPATGYGLSVMPLPTAPSVSLPSATPLPTATPVSSAIFYPSSATVTPMSDDVWDRIIAHKKIVVGTDWDYPPFASVDSNLHVVGYDIALISEIGKRLNIPVEIQNFSFEGLPNALQINQIDLAVAAISITPERASRMTFSPIYYINQTAILARAGSPIPYITNINQMKGYRVGVQRATTYQNWVQHSLVDAGLLPASQLLSYIKAEDAVRDLVENRVDLVVLGQATASFYNSQKGLRMVWQGTDQQNLAVAMRLGTPRLKAEIDRVMRDMLIDGTILRFIQQYIQTDIAEVLPTAIPLAQPTPTALPPIPTATPAACVDGMKFVADVTYGDNNMQDLPLLKPGEGFVKTWRLQNSGTCVWTPNYHLVYAYGNGDFAQMNGQQVSITGNVVSGSNADVSVTLIAPHTPSIYQGFWQIENPKGEHFGQTIWVGITTDPNQTTILPQPNTANCEVTLTSPGRSLSTNEDFDATWVVKNVSGSDWSSASVDYKYISGTKMQKTNAYDIPKTIKNGVSGTFIVDMTAPDKIGTYSAQWAVVAGSTTLCNLLVTIKVK